ncbi:MAG: tetratricopeptide repeat protein [Candidatus Eiseniibacteriota bacterium]
MSSELRSRWLWLAILFGVLLRAEYLRELSGTPIGRILVLDGVFYEQAARHILDGNPLQADPGSFRAPLYPFFLAAVRFFFPEGLLAPRLAQMLLGLVTVVLVRSIALRTHGQRVADVAAFLAAGYGMLIYHEGEILGVALGVTLQTASVLLLLDAGRRESTARTIAGGLALGLTAVTHATALAVAPAAFFWMWWVGRAGPRGPLVTRLAALTVAVTLPVALTTWRNWLASDDFVLIATQGGINFYVGNNAEADGRTSLVPGRVEADYVTAEYRDLFEVAAEEIAERETGRDLSASEINGWWVDRAKAWMRSDPKAAAVLMARKAILCWSGLENSNNVDLEDQAERFTPILRVFLPQLSIIMPFAILGLLLFRGVPRETRLLVATILVYQVSITAFFVCSRFRQPVTALLLPFAAAGVVGLVDRVRSARGGALAGTVVLLAGLFAATNERLLDRIGVLDLSLPNAPFHRYNLGVMLEQEGDLEGAIAEYRAAAAEHPEDPRVGLNLGSLLSRLGRSDEAAREFDRVMAISPELAPRVHWVAGIGAIQTREWTEAIHHLREVLRLDPHHPDAGFALGSVYLSAGRFEEAVAVLEPLAAAKEGPEPLLRRNLGMALLELGRLDAAERELSEAQRLAPRDPAVVSALARLRSLRDAAASQPSADRGR